VLEKCARVTRRIDVEEATREGTSIVFSRLE
jgi:hypothetical protein